MSSCEWVVATPPRWGEPQVRAPWHHGGHGAVDVVGPVTPPGRANGRGWGTQECTQIGESGLLEPFWGICIHCCAASCAASCDTSYVEWHERLNHHGVPTAPPSVATSRLVGKPGSARAAPSRGWRLPETLTHTNPRRARKQPGATEQDGPSGGRDEPRVGNAL